MTDRIYYNDAYQTDFDARVTHVTTQDGRTVVSLDRTAFYPTSGGQPHDTGRLGQSLVRDVFETPDGDIGHVVDGELAVGSRVRGGIDWRRRFDHMQQHTGQHVLSAAFVHGLRAPTVSFHLGQETSTIDLEGQVSRDEARDAEDEANRVVWENRPVVVRFADATEVAGLPLRKVSSRTGELRLIDVSEFDLSACGGTHVGHTGAIGLIALTGVERYKRGTRVEFACGGRALRALRVFHDSATESVRLLSVLPPDLPDAIRRLQADNKTLARTSKTLHEKLAAAEADDLVRRAADVSGCRLVVEIVDDHDAAGLKALGRDVARRPSHGAVLVSSARPVTVVAAFAEDTALDAGVVIRRLIERFGGRGGGKPGLAQAGGLDVEAAVVTATARELIDRDLG